MTKAAPQPAWAAARVTRAARGHETRTLLLAAAATVFGRLGYTRTTVADITAEAKVSRPTFYVYFASREEVFAEVAAWVRDEFLSAHEIPGVDESDPYALGRASTQAFLAAYAAHNDLLTVIEHQAISDPEIAKIWAEIQQRPKLRVARYIRRLTAEGVARPAAPADVLAEGIVGMISSLGRSAPDDEQEFATLVEAQTAMYLRLLGINDAPGTCPKPANPDTPQGI